MIFPTHEGRESVIGPTLAELSIATSVVLAKEEASGASLVQVCPVQARTRPSDGHRVAIVTVGSDVSLLVSHDRLLNVGDVSCEAGTSL